MGDEKKNPFSFGGKPKADGAKPNPFGGAKTGGTPSFTNSFSKKKEGQAAPATGTGTKTTTPFGTKPAAGAKAPPFGTKPAATKPAAAAGEAFKPSGVSNNLFAKSGASGGSSLFSKKKEEPAAAAATGAAAEQPKAAAAATSEKPKNAFGKPKAAGETPFTKSTSAATSGGAAGDGAAKAEGSGTAIAASAVPMKDRIKAKMTYKEVGDKLNEWNADLKKKEQEFLKQAEDVKKRDDAIRMNDVRIRMLHDKVQVIKERHKRLNGDVEVMISRQDEISDYLRRLRERVQHDTRPMARNDAREQTFALAEEIRHRLQETHRELSSVIDQLRGSSETDDGADANAMTHIGQILGAHVDTLVWVHQRTDTLEQRLDALERSKKAAPGISGY
eukprot:m.445634 g.445634  ORF g.445634 m.445634 type:complete len:389 (+) comp19258_c0_seq1:316-1482(+)